MHVELLAYTPDADKIVAAAAKLCYSKSKIDDLLDNLTPEKTESFLDMLSSLGHESPVEHASFTFGIEGVSRTLLAQITRQRIASYSVQSQRYVSKADFDYILPPEIEKIPEAKAEFIAAMEEDARHYESLRTMLTEAHTARFISEGKDETSARRAAGEQLRRKGCARLHDCKRHYPRAAGPLQGHCGRPGSVQVVTGRVHRELQRYRC